MYTCTYTKCSKLFVHKQDSSLVLLQVDCDYGMVFLMIQDYKIYEKLKGEEEEEEGIQMSCVLMQLLLNKN